MRRALGLLATAALPLAVLPVTAAGAAPPSRTACDGRERIAVPGAELQRVSPRLSDLTTTGLLARGFVPARRAGLRGRQGVRRLDAAGRGGGAAG